MVIFKTIWDFVKKIIKSKWFWFILLGLLLIFFIWKNRENKLEAERLSTNNTVLNQSMKVLKTKNGELYYSVNALTLKKNEFKDANSVLNKRLTEMGIKLKNVQSVTEMDINYIEGYDKIEAYPYIIHDTVFVPTVMDSTNIFNNKTLKQYISEYAFADKKESSTISGKINVPITYVKEDNLFLINKSINPYVTDIQFKISDTLTVVPTINYKRVWIFFKRPQSVTVFIKSENKAFVLDQIKTYQIVK